MRWILGVLGLALSLVGCNYPLEVRKDKAELAFYMEEFAQPGVQVMEMSYYRANPTKVTVQPRPVLVANSGMLDSAELVDSPDGLFAMQLKHMIIVNIKYFFILIRYSDNYINKKSLNTRYATIMIIINSDIRAEMKK